MKDYLTSFLTEFDYPKEAFVELQNALSCLLTCPMADDFTRLLCEYEKDADVPYNDFFSLMDSISECAGIHPYTGVFLLLALLTKSARKHWKAKGYSDDLFYHTFLDLRYKIVECKLVKGVWGTFVAKWYPRFFKTEIFALGRLQYEIVPLGKSFTIGDLCLTETSPVVSMHIPRTGEGMPPEEIDKSFALAKAFFREEFQRRNAPLVFHCESWLLFPEHETMLKEGSNILAFSRRFTRIDCGYNKGYGELWRYFDMDYRDDITTLPTTNSLYRAYVERVRLGLPIGWGEGIIVP